MVRSAKAALLRAEAQGVVGEGRGEVKLERELHEVVYWFLGAALAVATVVVVLGSLLAIDFVIYGLTGSGETADSVWEGLSGLASLLGPLFAISIATMGRYGKMAVTNFLITFVICAMPVLGFVTLPYYVGKGLWMLVTRQKAIIKE